MTITNESNFLPPVATKPQVPLIETKSEIVKTEIESIQEDLAKAYVAMSINENSFTLPFIIIKLHFQAATFYFKEKNIELARENVSMAIHAENIYSFYKAYCASIKSMILEWIKLSTGKTFPEPSQKMATRLMDEAEKKPHDKKNEIAIMALFDEAILYDPLNHACYLARGNAYRKYKKFKEAYTDFLLARWACLNQESTTIPLISTFISLYTYSLLLRKIDIKLGYLERAKHNHNFLIEIGQAFYKKQTQLTSTIKFNFSETNCNIDFGKLLLEKGIEFFHDEDYENALVFLQTSIEFAPKELASYLLIAKTFKLLDQLDNAEQILQEALIQFPKNEKILRRLAQLHPVIEEIHVENKSKTKSGPSFVKKLSVINKSKTILSDEFHIKNLLDNMITIIENKADEHTKKDQQFFRENSIREKEVERQQAREAKKNKIELKRMQKNEKIKQRRQEKRKKVIQTAPPLKLSASSVKNSYAITKIASQEPMSLPPILTPPLLDDALDIDDVFDMAPDSFRDITNYESVITIALQSFEREVMTCLEAYCKHPIFLTGSSVRERIRHKLLSIPAIFNLEQDRDFVTTASAQDIMTALKQFNVTPSQKKGLFHFFYKDVAGNQFKVEIWQSQFKTLHDDAENRDYTVNALYANSNGQVIDPTRNGFTDIKSNTLRTTKIMERTFKEDPWRIIRGLELAEKNKMIIPPVLNQQMKEDLKLLSTMKEDFCIHSWIMKSFSRLYATPEVALQKWDFLCRHHLLDKLFDARSAEKLVREAAWIQQELQGGKVKTRQQIYMIFYVSIAMQTLADHTDNYQYLIFSTNPLLKNGLSGFKGFRPQFELMQQARDIFFSARESKESVNLPQTQITPSLTIVKQLP